MISSLFNNDTATAAPAGTRVLPTYSTHSDDSVVRDVGTYSQIGNYIVSSEPSKQVTIDIPANAGKKIKSLAWYDADGNKIRNALGNWAGKPSFSATESISGTQLTVKAVGGTPYGGIYYWDRSSGSNTWVSGGEVYGVKYPNSSTCPSAPPDTWGYKAYPNCTDDRLPANLVKKEPYIIQSTSISEIKGGRIIDTAVEMKSIKPVDIKPDPEFNVTNSMYGGGGKSDPSTKYLGNYDLATSKDRITIRFQQTFGINSIENNYYKDFANPGARQMWYYAAFNFALEASTYLYKDKQLYVEWEDAGTDGGIVNIKHMVRTTAGGAYAQVAESSESLELSTPKMYSTNSSYGTIQGYSLSFSSYVNTPQDNKSSVSVALTASQKTAYVTFFYENLKSFSGDLDVTPSSITWKDSFTIKPKNIVMNSCTYVSHQYKIEREGSTWTSSDVVGQSKSSTYTFSSYPWVIGVGVHDIYLKIKTSNCGESDWIGPKPLTVKSPANNNPPDFHVGWVTTGKQTQADVQTSVVVGTVLDIIMLSDPPPSDPDGDWVEFLGFDFSDYNAWSKSVPSRGVGFMDGIHKILMDTEGYFCGKGALRDQWGLTVTKTTCVSVVPPNPIPIIKGSTSVVEGRPLAVALDATGSYSPVGRSIDHARDEWVNKKSVYTTVGTEQVKLDVYDSYGLKSLSPAVHTITVKPDLPPVALLNYTPITVRGQPVTFTNNSYSPDGDKIVSNVVQLRYDANNDGVFSEPPTTVTMDSNNQFQVNPTKVGKYQLSVRVVEDWGKEDSKNYILTVTNDSPTVAFYAQGEVSSPPSPGVTYNITPTHLMSSSWSTTIGGKPWSINTSDNSLSTVNLFNMTTKNYGIPKVNEWQGVDLSTATVTTIIPSSSNEIKLYQNFTLKQERLPGSIEKIVVYNNGVEVRRVSSTLSYVDMENQWLYIINGSNYHDEIYTFKGFSLGQAPVKDNYVYGLHYNASVGDSYFIAGEHSLLRILSIKFNHDLKLITNYGINSYSFANPFTSLSNIYDPSYPEVSSVGTESPMFPMGYDSKGNLYIETFDSHNSSGDLDGNYLMKADSLTGRLITKYYDGGSRTRSSGNKYDGYSWGGRVVGNEDGSKIAYTFRKTSYGDNVHKLIVRSEATGVIISSIDTSEVIHTRYKNLIITHDGATLRARNFDNPATVVWSSAFSGIVQIYTANGFAYGTMTGQKKIYSVDLNNGSVSSVDVSSHYDPLGIPSNYNVGFTLKILGDGALGVEIPLSDYFGNKREFVISGNVMDRNFNYDLYGNFVTASIPKLENFNIMYKLKFNTTSFDQQSGFSFRVIDDQNMYKVESSSTKTRLVKIVNGKRTVLGEHAYEMDAHSYYTIKISTLFDGIKVYINGVPIIDIKDTALPNSGMFGPYANAALVEFKDMSITEIKADKSLLDNIAIVNEPITYVTSYFDTEDDPSIKALRSWGVEHVEPNKFLNAGDGKSGISIYNGTTATGIPPALDRVGLYQITYQIPDDPHPDYLYPAMEFSEYRKNSNAYTQQIIVHRKPIAVYALSINTSTKKVQWADTSYDPDRWLSTSNYSTENTGIDYSSTRGVLERKYYFTSPSGITKSEKLITPTELGIYTVGLAVKDEFGAWSDWNEQQITITTIVTPNTPPVPGFTTSHINTFRGVDITIDSTAYDAEDGDRTKLKHEYFIRNLTTSGAESLQSTVRTSWIKSFNTLGTFNIRQVVEDSDGATGQYEKQITIHNHIPSANVTVPGSADQNNPTKLTVLRPTFTWTYSDQDGDTQTQYQVRISKYNGTLVLDSSIRNGAAVSWIASEDLPEKVNMYIEVRVHDGYDWSNWSVKKYFYIETNRPPTGDFSWSPSLIYEGDTVRFITTVDDPDLDPLKVRYEITSPAGDKQVFDYSLNSPYPTVGPTIIVGTVGTWTIKLTVSDAKAAPVTVTKSFPVNALTLQGYVRHTPDWERNRLRFNEKNDPDRPPSTFWAGEAFVLEADTTDTGASTTKAQSVRVQMFGSNSKQLMAQNVYFTFWSSLLVSTDTNIRFSELKNGSHAFIFTVTYSNGITKTSTVTIDIEDTVDHYVQVHRVQ